MNEAVILELYKNQKHLYSGELKGTRAENASCGDEVGLILETEGDIISHASYSISACSITIASAEYLCAFLEGKKVSEVNVSEIKNAMLKEFEMTENDSRASCALLPFRALETALGEI